MIKWEFGELYRDSDGYYFFDGNKLNTCGWGVRHLIEAMNLLGEEGWDFAMKYKDGYDEEVIVLKREK